MTARARHKAKIDKAKKARELKLPESRPVDVSALLQEGVVVTLSMGRWRAEARLRPEDVGIQKLDPEFVREFLSLGKKTLIPPDVQRMFNSLEYTCRYAIKMFSFQTPFGLFVPAAAFPALEEIMEEKRKLWMKRRDELIENRDKYFSEVRKEYRSFAKQLWKRRKIVRTATRAQTRESFAIGFARETIGHIPSEEEIRDSFHFEFRAFQVPIPKVLKRAAQKSLLEDAGLRAKRKTIVTREIAKREMNQRLQQKYERERERLMGGFLKDVTSQLRSMVFEVASNALDSVRKNDGMLLGRTSNQLKGLIRRYRMLNILDDKEVGQVLDKLEVHLAKTPRDRKIKDIKNQLWQLQSMSRSLLVDLSSRGRGTRRLEFNDSAIDKERMPSMERRVTRSL